MPEKIYVGDLESLVENKKVEGKQLKIGNENFYKITNVDKMRPFFMSIVSNSNHWMFISSTSTFWKYVSKIKIHYLLFKISIIF